MMKIMVPLSSFEDIDKFSEAGADEFYFGFYDDEWTKKYGDFEEINRMSSFGSAANFSISDCEDVIRKVHSKGKKAFVTLNSAMYSSGQIEWLLKKIDEYRLYNADGIISGSISMVLKLKKYDIPVTVSTMGGLYNSDIIEFYRKLNIKRVILPRDMKISDMELIIKKYPDMEFEVFLMRNGCKYSDSNCMSYHSRRFGSMCSCIDRQNGIFELCPNLSVSDKKEIYANNFLFTRAFHKSACGICSIEKFRNMEISSLKIVGRADSSFKLEYDIKLVKSIISKKSDEIQSLPYQNCLYGLNCYYH